MKFGMGKGKEVIKLVSDEAMNEHRSNEETSNVSEMSQPGKEVIESHTIDLTAIYDVTQKVFPNDRMSQEEFICDIQLAIDDINTGHDLLGHLVRGETDFTSAIKIRQGTLEDDDFIPSPRLALAAVLYKVIEKYGDMSGIENGFEINPPGTRAGESYIINRHGIWRHDFGDREMILLAPTKTTRLPIGTFALPNEEIVEDLLLDNNSPTIKSPD
jgi:hypothetical protein